MKEDVSTQQNVKTINYSADGIGFRMGCPDRADQK